MELNSLVFPRPTNQWKPSTLANQLIFVPRKPMIAVKRSESPLEIKRCLKVPRMQTCSLKTSKELSWWAAGTEELSPEEEIDRKKAKNLISRPLFAGKSIGMLNKMKLKIVSSNSEGSSVPTEPKVGTETTHPDNSQLEDSNMDSVEESQSVIRIGTLKAKRLALKPRANDLPGDHYVQKSLQSLKNSLKLFPKTSPASQKPMLTEDARWTQPFNPTSVVGKGTFDMLRSLQKISPAPKGIPIALTQQATPTWSPIKQSISKPSIDGHFALGFNRMSNLTFSSTKSIQSTKLTNQLAYVLDNFDYEQLSAIPGLLLPPPQPSDSIILYFHANGEDIYQTQGLCQALGAKLNMWILAPEFPGYSLYKSKTPEENQVLTDAQRLLEFLHKDLFIPLQKIVIMGRSLGTGPAIHLASVFPNIASLVVISPFTCIKEAAGDLLGALARFLVKDRFKNVEKITTVTCPSLFIHGKLDKVVPYSHSEKLYGRPR